MTLTAGERFLFVGLLLAVVASALTFAFLERTLGTTVQRTAPFTIRVEQALEAGEYPYIIAEAKQKFETEQKAKREKLYKELKEKGFTPALLLTAVKFSLELKVVETPKEAFDKALKEAKGKSVAVENLDSFFQIHAISGAQIIKKTFVPPETIFTNPHHIYWFRWFETGGIVRYEHTYGTYDIPPIPWDFPGRTVYFKSVSDDGIMFEYFSPSAMHLDRYGKWIPIGLAVLFLTYALALTLRTARERARARTSAPPQS